MPARRDGQARRGRTARAGFSARAAAWLAVLPGALVPLALLSLAGCGGGAPAPAGPAATLVRRLAPADSALRFVAGGAPGDLLVRCGARQARLTFGNETLGFAAADDGDYLAAWRDPKAAVERALGAGAAGPLLTENGQAFALPGWPAGATAEAAAFSPDGRQLAVGLSGGDRPGTVGVWPVPLGAPRFLGDRGATAGRLLCWSGDGRTLALVDAANRLSIYRLPKTKAVYTLAFDPGTEGRVTALDLSPDGDWYVLAANAVILRAWQLPFMNTHLQPSGRVKAVFFAGEVGSVITLDETNTAIRWAVNYGDVRLAVSRHLDGVDFVRAPTAGQYFAGVDSAGVVHGWRAGDLQPLLSDVGDRPFCR